MTDLSVAEGRGKDKRKLWMLQEWVFWTTAELK